MSATAQSRSARESVKASAVGQRTATTRAIAQPRAPACARRSGLSLVTVYDVLRSSLRCARRGLPSSLSWRLLEMGLAVRKDTVAVRLRCAHPPPPLRLIPPVCSGVRCNADGCERELSSDARRRWLSEPGAIVVRVWRVSSTMGNAQRRAGGRAAAAGTVGLDARAAQRAQRSRAERDGAHEPASLSDPAATDGHSATAATDRALTFGRASCSQSHRSRPRLRCTAPHSDRSRDSRHRHQSSSPLSCPLAALTRAQSIGLIPLALSSHSAAHSHSIAPAHADLSRASPHCSHACLLLASPPLPLPRMHRRRIDHLLPSYPRLLPVLPSNATGASMVPSQAPHGG